MKKYIALCLTLLFFSLQLISQNIDKVVNKNIYTSYYSIKLKVPLYIEYDLLKYNFAILKFLFSKYKVPNA